MEPVIKIRDMRKVYDLGRTQVVALDQLRLSADMLFNSDSCAASSPTAAYSLNPARHLGLGRM